MVGRLLLLQRLLLLLLLLARLRLPRLLLLRLLLRLLAVKEGRMRSSSRVDGKKHACAPPPAGVGTALLL